MENRHVAVIGAGTMGHGIAHVAALAGMNVALFDALEGAAEKGLSSIRQNLEKGVARGKVTEADRDMALAKVHVEKTVADAAAGVDLVIEAVVESLDVKTALFAELDRVAPEQAILATNTSSIWVTKVAAEDLCQLFHRNHGLACIVLRTSRFFPEPDDDEAMREAYGEENAKVNEMLHRRVDVEDVVSAHLLAAERAPAIGFGRFIVSATTPFEPEDLRALRTDAPRVVGRLFPEYVREYA